MAARKPTKKVVKRKKAKMLSPREVLMKQLAQLKGDMMSLESAIGGLIDNLEAAVNRFEETGGDAEGQEEDAGHTVAGWGDNT